MATSLLSDAVEQTLALGENRAYAACTHGFSDSKGEFLKRLTADGSLTTVLSESREPESTSSSGFGDFAAVVKGPIAGCLIDLAFPYPYNCSTWASTPSESGIQARIAKYLHNAAPEELVRTLEKYTSLHDPWLAKRIGEGIAEKQRAIGRPLSESELSSIVAELRPLFEVDHPTFDVRQVIRAIRVVVNREVEQLRKALEGAFERLETSGRCAIITYNPWESQAVLQFLHAHEEPVAEVMSTVSADRLADLYPLLSSGKDYVARRVQIPKKVTQEQLEQVGRERVGVLQVLEKIPLQRRLRGSECTTANPVIQRGSAVAVEAPVVPEFRGEALSPPSSPAVSSSSSPRDLAAVPCCSCGSGVAKLLPPCVVDLVNFICAKSARNIHSQGDEAAQPEGVAASDEIPLTAAQKEEKEVLTQKIAARKKELKLAGISLSQQKKDKQLAELVKRLNSLHSAKPNVAAKIHQRCRDRAHYSVLLHEAVEHTVAPGPNGLYVDCTFGRGGHTKHLLSKLSEGGRVKSFDVDPVAVEVGRAIQRDDNRFEMLHRPFGDLGAVINEPLSGVLLDLGVSSPQLDDRSRGFSTKSKKDGPLDLRMNQDSGIPASEWLQTVTSGQLAWVLRATCHRLEHPLPERIAEAILHRQEQLGGVYKSTSELTSVLDEFSCELSDDKANTSLAHIIFVSIRVFLNREMGQLDAVLQGAFDKLAPYGRCVVICFNLWEISAMRRFIREHELPGAPLDALLPQERLVELYPVLKSGKNYSVRQVVQPVKPSAEELARNQRSKSLMFVLEKVPR